MVKFCWVIIFSCIATFALAQERLTYVDLVKRLTDLDRLATLPAPGEKTAQWSSYNRASRYDETTGKYIAWSVNRDGGSYIREEGDSIVMAEMEGPGCIWRIWSAAPKEGHVRIYLDGANEPTVDLPFVGYFDAKNEPFTRSALVHTVARGWNNYTPIPYQKSCKIVADKGWGLYYHFGYTTYPKGTQVPTFKRQLSADEIVALDEANKVLGGCGPFGPPNAVERTEQQKLSLPRGGKSVLTLAGPGVITTIRARVENLPPSPGDRIALRELTFQIFWDREKAPSVWAPFADFFGTAPGANPYLSLPSGLTKDGWWYCHWYMPFASQAEIVLQNDGKQERTIYLEVVHRPLRGNPDQLLRFHAKWHRDAFLPVEKERAIDWTLLKAEGAGRFVGVMLHVWNPRGNWWGEGDEKFFVDGEKFPSTFGTGSEDYFGYAWGNPTLFQNAYHSQTLGNNNGHVSLNRWHIADQVPFHTSFEGCIEKYFPNQRPTLYAATVYWYLSPGGKDPYATVALKKRVGYWM